MRDAREVREQAGKAATRLFRAAFAESGLTQAAAASMLGISESSLRNHVNGTHQPMADVFVAMLAIAKGAKRGWRM